MKDKLCVFPGSFNPFTLGHMDVVMGALELFEEVIVAVAEITYKDEAPSAKIRAKIAEKSLDGIAGVRVEYFGGMLTDYLAEKRCFVMARGIRDQSDRDYEKILLDEYKKMDERVEAVYIEAARPFISSGAVRKLIKEKAEEELKIYVAKSALDDILKFYR